MEDKLVIMHYDNLGGMNEKASRYLTGLQQFINLVNFDLESPGAISKRPGSTQYLFAGTSGVVNNIYEYQKTNGFSQVIVAANTGIYSVTDGRTLSPIITGFSQGNYVDMQTFLDTVWMVNGQTMMKYNGASVFAIGIPAAGSFTPGSSKIGQSTGVLLQSRYLLGYVNTNGFYGPVSRANMFAFDNEFYGGASANLLGISTTAATWSAIHALGITAKAIYRNDDGISYYPGNVRYDTSGVFYLLAVVGLSAATYEDSYGATTLVNQPIIADLEYDWTTLYDSFAVAYPNAARFLEIHQNSMFYAGFSAAPSNVLFSDLGTPESVRPDYVFEVRTDDGDWIRGLKSVNKQLLVFKENSFHKIIGDNPDNYELIEISTEYGAISDRAIVAVDGVCFFLDVKGIVKYDGSGWQCISSPVEPTFRRMNILAAKDQAVAAHYDFRNQIWFSFPVDASTRNNMTIVYDYEAKAWFKFEGFEAASLVRMDGGLNTRTLFYGSYSGMIYNFSPSLFGDNGQGISLVAQTRFEQPKGPYWVYNFRRLWVDNDPTTGGTITVDFMQNMSDTTITTLGFGQSGFQEKVEFLVNSKALGLRFHHYSATLPCQINGWAVGFDPVTAER